MSDNPKRDRAPGLRAGDALTKPDHLPNNTEKDPDR
jgi:hypothetical protein